MLHSQATQLRSLDDGPSLYWINLLRTKKAISKHNWMVCTEILNKMGRKCYKIPNSAKKHFFSDKQVRQKALLNDPNDPVPDSS